MEKILEGGKHIIDKDSFSILLSSRLQLMTNLINGTYQIIGRLKIKAALKRP
jgi:hypothetical protein